MLKGNDDDVSNNGGSKSGGDLTKIGGISEFTKELVCPDGCIIFKMTAKKLGNLNFHTGNFYKKF